MRRTLSFCIPTLLLSLVIQGLACLSQWFSFLPMPSQVFAAAPITPSGLNTQVNPAPTSPPGKVQYDITGGTRPGGGSNLFHSFGDFNVPTNNIANFLNDSGIATSNILGRVTGGNPSTIFGMIQTTNFGNANLFLMNPSGFLFGPNATLNVGGMVAFTTADYLRFQGSQTLFNNASTADSLSPLSIAPVAAFGFLGSNPAAIAVQGSTLTVAPGQSISLVGGSKGFTYTDPDTGNQAPAPVPGGVTITGGKLLAPAGQINVASVASAGEVLASNPQLQPNMEGASFTSLGNISIGQGARLDASGATNGTIMIRGGQLTIADGATITSAAISGPPAPAGSVTINGTGVQIAGSDVMLNGTNVAVAGATMTATNLDGSGGTIGLTAGNAGNVIVTQGALLDASGNGGGTVSIRGGNFLLDNSTISANVTGPGPVINGTESIGGGIDIQVSQNAVIQNLGVLETNVTGNATPGVTYGGVHVKADRIEILGTISFEDALMGIGDFSAFTGIRSNVSPGSMGGNSGSILLDANSILINNFAQVQTDTEGFGNAGKILFMANQNIDIDFGQIMSGQSGMFLSQPAQGDAGNVELTSAHGNISLTNGASISSVTIESPGTAGTVSLNAPSGNILLGDFTSLFTIIDPPINTNGVRAVRAGGSGGILINSNNLEVASGNIAISNGSDLPAGDITINLSGSLTLHAGSLFPIPSFIRALAQGPASSAGLNITAHDILITDGSSLTTSTITSGNAGPLNISAVNVQLTNGAQLSSASRQGLDPFTGEPSGPPPAGNAGTITIQGLDGPAQSVLIDGAGSGILTNTVGTGKGGSINLLAQSLTVQNGGKLSAETSGTAPSASGGTIVVKADTLNLNTGGTITATSTGAGAAGQITVQGLASPAQSILIDGTGSGIFTDTHDTGAGGDISVNVNSLTLQNSGALSAVSAGTAPSATGGMITVNAEHVTVNSQATITTDTNGIAPAGVININTGTLAMSSGGHIQSNSGAETEPPLRALALAPAAPPLTGGTITIQGQTGSGSQAGSVTIDGSGSGIFTQSSGNRPGGDINILTSGSVTMTNGAAISASSKGAGNAGSIQINAGNQLLMTDSSVTTEATQSGGGLIKITTTPSGNVQLTNSKISASVIDGNGGGGSVNIDPQFVILQNSQILADAVFGPGGNILITTNLLLQDANSRISASSQFGQQGTVTIQSPIAPAGGKIFPLTQKPLIAASLVNQRCAALAGGAYSSFTVAGRDSLPAEPGGWLSSPLALATTESAGGTMKEAGLQLELRTQNLELITEEESPLLSLRHIAPSGFLTQSFAVDSSGCQS